MAISPQMQEAFKKIKDKALDDLRSIDRDNLETEFNIAGKNSEWISIKFDWERLLNAADVEIRKMRGKKHHFYGREQDYRPTKDELNIMIEADVDYLELHERYIYIENVVRFTDTVIKKLSDKQWEIKNYLDYLRFTNGDMSLSEHRNRL